MKLLKYLKEIDYGISKTACSSQDIERLGGEAELKRLHETLVKNCKQYIKEAQGQLLWRGVRKTPKVITSITPRTNREPRDTPKFIHEYFDKELFKKFGWKPRSSGVFCTGDLKHAEEYGPAVSVWPIGNFKYLWSPEVMDLYLEVTHLRSKDPKEYDNLDYDLLKDMLNSYKNNNLREAILKGHEIMIGCNKYFAVSWLATNCLNFDDLK